MWGSSSYWLGYIALAVVAAGLIGWLTVRARRGSKVTSLTKYKKTRHTKQACSYCRKKASGLTFYSAGEGRVVGVCRDCKPKAERQDLLPI
jgi:hypothetical protein